MKILFIHAHFDDYEFTAGGTFELLRRKLGDSFQAKVLICTDGRAGHHFRTREETGPARLAEQAASAEEGGYEFEALKLPNGQIPREACLRVTTDLLAALWKSIRDFEPDYIFCPPVVTDPLAGMHVDHVAVAQAVREVAYMINVPHAFIEEYPADETKSEPCKIPVIINTYDTYQFGQHAHDLAINVEEAFDTIAKMSWCHESQVKEWLPWVGRHKMPVPESFEHWKTILRERCDLENRQFGFKTKHAVEVFAVTAWGAVPTYEQILSDFPSIVPKYSHLKKLRLRLKRWHNEPEE
ncbi:MAG: PIG-L deacetylase family protein [Verrucomicrobiia bacterium]|jgi:LmbE family N-acetylglucosaminyl deacetylase